MRRSVPVGRAPLHAAGARLAHEADAADALLGTRARVAALGRSIAGILLPVLAARPLLRAALGGPALRAAPTLPLALAATAAIGLLGPFAEELLFRGLIYGYVDGRFGARAAWAISSVLFALAHAEPAHVALVFPIGVLLGWVRMRSASLWPCVLAHMINNIVVVCWAYLDS